MRRLNKRQERFAQELARGRTAIAAYVTAGYSHNRSWASRLSNRPAIRARVEQLQARTVLAPEDVTLERLVGRLLEIAATAESDGAKGAALAVARASVMDVARLSGLLAKANAPPPPGKTLEQFLEELELEAPGPMQLLSETCRAIWKAEGEARLAGRTETAGRYADAARTAARAAALVRTAEEGTG